MDKLFWRGKRVLLTGHTGFKGSWTALLLSHWGAKVSGLALAPDTEPNLFTLAGVEAGLQHHIIADIRDLAAVKKAVQLVDPDIIIHMAAQPLVRYSYAHPVETYQVNVMGTVHILEAMRHSNAKVLVNVTTDKCYENQEREAGYREDEPMGGYDPYSNSKGCSELVTSAYRRSFMNPQAFDQHGKAVASARAGNVIGGGDWAQDRLIPDIITALLNRQVPQIRNPDAIRPWQHVLEPISGYLTLAEKLYAAPTQYAEGWNFGPRISDCKTVGEVADSLVACWGNGATWQANIDPHAVHEAHFLKLDIAKAQQRLKWQPVWPIADAIRYTVDWYRAWQQGDNMQTISLQQIDEYTAKAASDL